MGLFVGLTIACIWSQSRLLGGVCSVTFIFVRFVRFDMRAYTFFGHLANKSIDCSNRIEFLHHIL